MIQQVIKVAVLLFVLNISVQAGVDKVQFKIMNLAIEQTVIIPNIIKHFVSVKMHFKVARSKALLEKDIEIFERINREFEAMTLDDAEVKLRKNNAKLWQLAKQAAMETPKNETLGELKKKLPAVFKNRMMLAKHAQEKSGNKKAKVFLLLGKLTALPQKFAGMYMSLKHAKGKERERIVGVIKKYADAYKGALGKIKEKVGEKSAIKKIEKDMSFFEFALAPERVFMPALIMKKTDVMSANAKKIKEMILKKMKK